MSAHRKTTHSHQTDARDSCQATLLRVYHGMCANVLPLRACLSVCREGSETIRAEGGGSGPGCDRNPLARLVRFVRFVRTGFASRTTRSPLSDFLPFLFLSHTFSNEPDSPKV